MSTFPAYDDRPVRSEAMEALMDALICATLERRGPGRYQVELESMIAAYSYEEGFVGLEHAGVTRVELSNGDIISVPDRTVLGLLWSEALDREEVTKTRRDSVYPSVCAWCGLVMNPGDPGRLTTHGCCPDDRDAMLAEVRSRG